jgi:hypothetical protein
LHLWRQRGLYSPYEFEQERWNAGWEITETLFGVTQRTMLEFNFVNSGAFRKLCDGVFRKIDENGDGQIDLNELTLATCHLHYKLCKKSPGVTEPPSAELVASTLDRYDMDKTGSLSEIEFYNFAKRWFSEKGVAFLQRLFVTSFIWMVVLPESAGILHRELPAARKIPKAIFKVVFGISTYGTRPTVMIQFLSRYRSVRTFACELHGLILFSAPLLCFQYSLSDPPLRFSRRQSSSSWL